LEMLNFFVQRLPGQVWQFLTFRQLASDAHAAAEQATK